MKLKAGEKSARFPTLEQASVSLQRPWVLCINACVAFSKSLCSPAFLHPVVALGVSTVFLAV